MADNISKKTLVGAFFDFIIICLLLAGAGFGGYFWGTHQRLVPVMMVPPGTPGAKTAAEVGLDTKDDKSIPAKPGEAAAAAPATAAHTAPAATSSTASTAKSGVTKYWLISSGSDYVGYNITVNVGSDPVDSFFGPDKIVDITKHIKPGQQISINFDAKQMGEQFNKYTGDASKELTIRLVKGPHVADTFSDKDVIMSFSRNAAQTESDQETKTFTAAAK